MSIQQALEKILTGQGLTEQEMIAVMQAIMEGAVPAAPMAAFLTALRMKGETVEEILGAARVMREKAETVSVDADPVVDTCGTGGDGGQTFNISTAAAFVAAGAGVTVAKHGNRAVSSQSGSADVLKCLGVNVDADKERVETCLRKTGIGFLFAPLMHRAMKHAAAVRKELGIRTLFNLLGPLTNPAGAHAQVVGVFDGKWIVPLAEVLKALGARQALVVHGDDGLDEISLMSGTRVAELKDGCVREYAVSPEDFGFKRCSPLLVRGGMPEENAAIVRAVLEGRPGPHLDIVLVNAGAAIFVSGKADSLLAGVEAARESVLSGAAQKKLEDLIRVSNA